MCSSDLGGVLPSGMVRIAAGRSTQTVTVNVFCDRMAEFDEQFTITLGTPVGGLDVLRAGSSSAIGTIRNDDPGTPRPAALIMAQAFAALVESAGPAGSGTTKRAASAAKPPA